MLTEAERNINLTQPPPPGATADALAARSLIGTKRDVRGSAIFNRQILGDVSATLNAEIEHNEGPLADRPWRDSARRRSRATPRRTARTLGIDPQLGTRRGGTGT